MLSRLQDISRRFHACWRAAYYADAIVSAIRFGDFLPPPGLPPAEITPEAFRQQASPL
jgi:hypothetical protein